MLVSFSIDGIRGLDTRYYESLPLARYQAIIGANGSGKTHIIEGIHAISGGTIHYASHAKHEIITFGANFQEALGEKHYALSKGEKNDIYSIQGQKVTGKKYRTSLPYRTVLISPFDMNLLYFAPAARRDFIDNILDRTFAQFHTIKRDYEKIMRQRNTLLKRIRDGESKREDLDFWDTSFSEKATLYALYREQWYTFMTENQEIITELLPKYDISCVYESKYFTEADRESYIRSYLAENRERDILTGHTHIGPHLDDFHFEITVGKKKVDASTFLSRGENKMLLIGLKQIEILFLRKYLELPIVLLFDDLFAELDMRHAEKIIEKFEVDQMIITTQKELPKSQKWQHFSCINLSPE